MSELHAGNVLKAPPALSPTDSVERAITLLHRQALPALVVVCNGQPVGLFTEETLLAHFGQPAGDWENLATLAVEQVMAPAAVLIHEATPLSQVADAFRHYPVAVLPVVDSLGNYRGIATRQDTVAALCNVVYPGRIAGMATPLGVYLTNGVVRAGAGDAGLFLAGIFLSAQWAVAAALVSAICWAVQAFTPIPLLAIREGGGTYLGTLYFGDTGFWQGAIFVAQLVAFFVLMRLLPLSGTHGAEHQVVHAIEHGEALTPQTVLAHTTVHPRCGTNLAAMMMVMGAGIYYLSTRQLADPSMMVIYMFVVVILALLLRQRIGSFLQRAITTRQPTQEQAVAAVQVGRQLLERCRSYRGEMRSGFFQRLWTMGLVQVLTGAALTSYLLQLVQEFLGGSLLP